MVKMLNLMVPGTIVKKEALGVMLHIKVMSPYDAAIFANQIAESKGIEGYDLVIEKIVKIEGYTETPAEVLSKLSSVDDFVVIMQAVIGANTLEDEEVKNSPSSSD